MTETEQPPEVQPEAPSEGELIANALADELAAVDAAIAARGGNPLMPKSSQLPSRGTGLMFPR